MLFWKHLWHTNDTHTQFTDFCTLFSLEVNFPVWRFWASTLSRVSQTKPQQQTNQLQSSELLSVAARNSSCFLVDPSHDASLYQTCDPLVPTGEFYTALIRQHRPRVTHEPVHVALAVQPLLLVCFVCSFQHEPVTHICTIKQTGEWVSGTCRQRTGSRR